MKKNDRFETVDGSVDVGDVVVYALSTCGFCKRALSFLRQNSVKFRFVYVDDLPGDEKDTIKKQIGEKFQRTIRYPFLVFNDERILVGFDESEWKSLLELKS